MKAAFITMPFPGVRRVGEEGAKLGLWELVLLEGGRVAIPPADLYILGAYHPVYQAQILGALAGQRVGVCWTSSAAEMELNAPVEFDYLQKVLADPRIAFVWFGDPGLAQVFDQKAWYYPYPLDFRPQPPADKRDVLTLFCPDKPSKNIFTQLLAVAIIQQKRPELVLHTNVGDLRGLEKRLNVVQHPWLPRPEYDQLLAAARLNLAVSHAETMCYQAAEAVMLGTPSLMSPAVPWAPLTCPPNDATIMGDPTLLWLDYPEEFLQEQRQALARYAAGFDPQEWQGFCLDRPVPQPL